MIDDLFENTSKLKILVLGDIMLDEYIYGRIDRVSPEAPVPVVLQEATRDVLGGAANVASNLTALGASVILIGTIGHDNNGNRISNLLSTDDRITNKLIGTTRKTTTKTRIISNGKQVIRLDHEVTSPISGDIEEQIMSVIHDNLSDLDGIIIQDYNKGLITAPLINKVLSLADDNDIATFVDPKERNFYAYRGATIFKPNRKELALASNINLDLQTQMSTAYDKLDCEYLICTLAENGIAGYSTTGYQESPTEKIGVADVSGAGDSVMAILAIAYCLGYSMENLLILGNIAGRLACQIPEVGRISLNEIRKTIAP